MYCVMVVPPGFRDWQLKKSKATSGEAFDFARELLDSDPERKYYARVGVRAGLRGSITPVERR